MIFRKYHNGLDKGRLRICLAASAGGHLTQLLKLADSWKPYEAVYVSTADAVAKELQQLGPAYIVGECNRKQPFKSLLVLMQCFRIVLKHHPDVAISTGALPGFLLCTMAKIFGAKIVWIDSLANVNRLSMSGWMIRPYSSLVLTQWPQLAKKSKKVEYIGAVI